MAEKYQDSLDLFKTIYFKEDGTLDNEGYDPAGEKNEYYKLGKDMSNEGDGKSKIIGKSAFTPRIVREHIKRSRTNPDLVEGYRYFLTVDPQGRFDHHFQLPKYPKAKITPKALELYKSKRRVDITDMTQEDIMKKVSQMLNMSNEEIMEMFNIDETYSTKVKIELLVDDVIQKYIEEQGSNITEKSYGPEWGMRTTTDKEIVKQYHYGFEPTRLSTIEIKPEDGVYGGSLDTINYKVLTPQENDIDKIRIEIVDEFSKASSELGQLILQTLRERFTERQVEEEQVKSKTEQTTEEKIGAEKIIDFMEQNNLEPNDLAIALSMVLARTTDRTNAEQHIVSEADRGNEKSESIKPEH